MRITHIVIAAFLVLALGAAAENVPIVVEGPPDVTDRGAAELGFSADAFVARIPALKRQVARALQVDPLPKRTPLNARSMGVIDGEEFTIEKIVYDSAPGVPVTANLYLPKNRTGRVPAILNLHGHWPGGKRSEQVRLRCAQMARMGFVAMAIDTFGSPGEGNERGHLGGHWDNDDLTDGPTVRLFATGVIPAAISVWDAIRAIDYLETRAEVDAAKIFTCGASFGATQALGAAIVDERVAGVVAVSYGSVFTNFPRMNSSELIPGIRKDVSQQELFALIAPRPLLLVQHFKEQPFVRETIEQVYSRLGAKESFAYEVHKGRHDFDKPKRKIVYRWLAKTLTGDESAPKESSKFPVHEDELFCYGTGRVPDSAKTIDDLMRAVERGTRAKAPLDPRAAGWNDRRASFVKILSAGIGYSSAAAEYEAKIFPIHVVDWAKERELPAAFAGYDEGSGAVCFLDSDGGIDAMAVRIVGEPGGETKGTRHARLAKLAQGIDRGVFCVVDFGGYERAVETARAKWALTGMSEEQIRYGANVISILEGRPLLYAKVRAIDRLARTIHERVEFPYRGLEFSSTIGAPNLALLSSALGTIEHAKIVMEPQRFVSSYKEGGGKKRSIAITPPGILRYVDVEGLITLHAPSEFTSGP